MNQPGDTELRGRVVRDTGDHLPETMTAVVCHGPEDYRLEVVDVPRRAPGGLLLRVEAVGICASDLKCFHGAAKFWGDETRPAWAEREVIPGHEFVGVVVQADEAASLRWGVGLGDRVVAEQIVPCGECRFCVHGQYHMCIPHDIFGFKRATHGGMAEFMAIPPNALVHRVSPSLPPAHAAFTEPLSCSLHAVQRAQVQFEDVVVVAGCGPIGLGMVAGAVATYPTAVVALDLDDRKLEVARRAGATHTVNIGREDPVELVGRLTDGLGADVYLEGTGHPSAVRQGLTLLRKQGRFVEYSVFREETTVDWTIISDDKELDVLGAHLGPGTWPTAIRMIEDGRLPLDDICTHQLPVREFARGLDLVSRGDESIKVTLLP
jgi:threonine dehydrogenase-like Zn-dependent dehydrogenase